MKASDIRTERRAAILALLEQSDMTVDELASHFPRANKQSVAHYLRKMRDSGLVHVHEYTAYMNRTIRYIGVYRKGPGTNAANPYKGGEATVKVRQRSAITQIPQASLPKPFLYGKASMAERYFYLCGIMEVGMEKKEIGK